MKTLLVLCFFSIAARASTLVMIGGGSRPTKALEAFVESSKGEILILPWGTGYPQESFQSIKSELTALGAREITCLCTLPLNSEDHQKLQRAGGIYFPGGDQNQIMQKLQDEKLIEVIRARFLAGTAIGGTSAGTAIQTSPMLTGDGTRTAEGLGLLAGFIVDQHFLVRRREARLLSVMSRYPSHRGLGIDEDMAVVIKNGTWSFYGPTEVIVYTHADGEIIQRRFREGDFLSPDLKSY